MLSTCILTIDSYNRSVGKCYSFPLFYIYAMKLNLSIGQLTWYWNFSKNIMCVAELETKTRFSDHQVFSHYLPGGGRWWRRVGTGRWAQPNVFHVAPSWGGVVVLAPKSPFEYVPPYRLTIFEHFCKYPITITASDAHSINLKNELLCPALMGTTKIK